MGAGAWSGWSLRLERMVSMARMDRRRAISMTERMSA